MKFDDIEMAFEYVSSEQPFMHSAYISRKTGQVYYVSELGDSDELPDDIDDEDLYVSIPHKNDLDLGRKLVFNFVAESLPSDIDEVSNMTEGTFVLLNRDIQSFTTNETGWTAVKSSISGNLLTITSQDSESTDTISWMVIGERQDDKIKSLTMTDDDGNLIVEPLKDS